MQNEVRLPLLQLFVRADRAREEGNVNGTVFSCREIELSRKLQFTSPSGAKMIVEDISEEIVVENLGTTDLLRIEPLVTPLSQTPGTQNNHSGALNLVKHLRKIRTMMRSR